MFYMSAGIATFGGLVFVLFAKGEELDWAKDSPAMVVHPVESAGLPEVAVGCKRGDSELENLVGKDCSDVNLRHMTLK